MEKESVPTKVSRQVRTRNAQYIYFGDVFNGVTDAQNARETRHLFQVSLEDHMRQPQPIGLKLQLTPEDILNAGERTKESPTKASIGHFPATSLTIGDFHIVATCEANLIAKCFYEKQKFVWEVLDESRLIKYKIEVLWENILTMHAHIEENRPGILQFELDKQPTFFCNTDPNPRKHPNWELSKDFTIGGHASIYRRHYLEFPPRVLDKCYEELIQCDSQLLKLAQSPFPSLNSPYFGSIILDEEATALETNPASHQQHMLPISPQEAQPFGNAISSTSVVDGDSLHNACDNPIPQDQELAFWSQGHNENANTLAIPGPSEVKNQYCRLEYENSNEHSMVPLANGSEEYLFGNNSSVNALYDVLFAEDRGPMVNNNGTSTHNGCFPNGSMAPPANGSEEYLFGSNSNVNALYDVLSAEDRGPMVNNTGTSTHNGYFSNGSMAPPANGSEEYLFGNNSSVNALYDVLFAEDRGPMVNNTGTSTHNGCFPNGSMAPPANGSEGYHLASNSSMNALHGVLFAEDQGPTVNNIGTITHNDYFPNNSMVPPPYRSERYHFASNSNMNNLRGVLSAEDRLMLTQALHRSIPPVHVRVANEDLETHLPNNPWYLNP